MLYLIHLFIFIKYNLFLLINPNKLDVVKIDNKGGHWVHRLTYDEVIELYNQGAKWRLSMLDLFNFNTKEKI